MSRRVVLSAVSIAAWAVLAAGCRAGGAAEARPSSEPETQPSIDTTASPAPSARPAATPAALDGLPDWDPAPSPAGARSREGEHFDIWEYLEPEDQGWDSYTDENSVNGEPADDLFDGAWEDDAIAPETESLPESTEPEPIPEVTVEFPTASEDPEDAGVLEDATDIVPAEAAPAIGLGGGTDASASDTALAWLKRHQDRDGKWDADGWQRHVEAMHTDDREILAAFEAARAGQGWATSDTGVTALALLAFLKQGYTGVGGGDQKPVTAALKYLIGIQQESGVIATKEEAAAGLYTIAHAQATLALCEAFAVSGRQSLAEPAQRAVDFLATVQVACLGWGEASAEQTRAESSNTRVTGWAVLALKSARLAELKVPDACFEGALAWVNLVTDEETGRTGFNERGRGTPRLSGSKHGECEVMTAMALVIRLHCGESKDSPAVTRGLALLEGSVPKWDRDGNTVDLEFWLFGGMAASQGPETLAAAWRAACGEQTGLAKHPEADGDLAGSVDPDADAWGAAGGRVYTTAMASLAAEAEIICYVPQEKPAGR